VNSSFFQVISALDALTGALFLLTALGVVAPRQVLASLQLFIMQSLLLALSAGLIGIALDSIHLLAVAAITIATKTLMIPWLLRRTVGAEAYRTREIERVLNIPSSLLLAAGIIGLAYVVAYPLLGAVKVPFEQINLPLGIAAMFLGAFTIVVRREAVPQLLGLLAVENGVFFAGIAIVRTCRSLQSSPPPWTSLLSLSSSVCWRAASTGAWERRPSAIFQRCGSVESWNWSRSSLFRFSPADCQCFRLAAASPHPSRLPQQRLSWRSLLPWQWIHRVQGT
jgi:hydrogenase-4 component E